MALLALLVTTGWSKPVPGPVVRPFQAPAGQYGSGHRGVDLAISPGEAVLAAADGTVVFAGTVAGARHVVVRHDPSGWLTSYSFLATIGVHRGERVRGGQPLGTAGGAATGNANGHDGTVLHFALRIDGRFVDPMRLFSAPDLAGLVHLVPFDAPPDRRLPVGVAPPTLVTALDIVERQLPSVAAQGR